MSDIEGAICDECGNKVGPLGCCGTIRQMASTPKIFVLREEDHIFGVYSTKEKADQALARFMRQNPTLAVWVAACSLDSDEEWPI